MDLRDAAEQAAKTYAAWISALVESQSRRNAKERAKLLAEFQHAMAQLQITLKAPVNS